MSWGKEIDKFLIFSWAVKKISDCKAKLCQSRHCEGCSTLPFSLKAAEARGKEAKEKAVLRD